MEALNLADWNQLAAKRLKRILRMARKFPSLLKAGGKQPWQVEVSMIGETKMTSLNRKYRGKNYPTDVLSFSSLSPFRERGQLGELVLCVPVLKAQAKAVSHSPLHEMDVLLAHGLLHLLGFDHEVSEAEARKMARWESKILRGLALGLLQRSDSGI